MGTDLGSIAFLAVVIFGALEFALVIIPAVISRAKVRNSYQPVYDVPIVLSRPVPAGQRAYMRSWYFDETIPFRYDIKFDPVPVIPENSEYLAEEFPVPPHPKHSSGQNAVKDWKAVNAANRAILRANKALLEANRAILEANTAMQEVTEDDLEWIDEIADLDQFRFLPRR